ncbi:glycosyltransferase family 4 protein [Oculatella sp. LEGE 06141]|uniref:glycosyltransferase family 4 protein n=1 Tax=Oculatella sp. LEGE 06141 TaxID=1828648 RepID=UPI001881E89D|nr:glycosyltransferase family 4 protein [Oculatella sp. LEGE 06141]MBE9178453.1 glycosyltransferase family 4 protein [Oculatella sp. LEGE 06141]
MSSHLPPSIALLHWGDVWEDFLDPIGVSLDAFCTEGPSGWMLGYIQALQTTGIRTVLVLISARVTEPVRFNHAATGATIAVLPASSLYRLIRRQMLNPHGQTLKDVFGSVAEIRPMRPLLALLNDAASYCATPLVWLSRELKREGCRAIVCQEYEYARFDVCVGLGQWLHLPVFATFQGGNFQVSRIERFLRPLAMKACAGLIVATGTEAQRVQSRYTIPAEKLACIFNPIDVTTWQAIDRFEARRAVGIPLEAQVAVCHGRIDIHRKGLDILIEAWEKVCRDRPQWDLRLLLVGTGSDAERLHQLISTKPLRGLMWIDEYIRDRTTIQQYLSAADVYTLPSRHEGFPVAPIEAMACGLPVVATDAPGVPDILVDGEASGGLVVPSGDALALASALGRVFDNAAWGRKVGQQARYRVEQCFSLEAIGQQLHDVLFNPK